MKEICGYVDLDGYFHKTQKECENADCRIKIKKVSSRLNSFSNEVSTILFLNGRDYHTPISYIEKHIYEQISKIILRDSEIFQQIIKDAKNLKNELDTLEKENKYKWWLKYKWW